jgi:hypothetical protein
MDDLELAEEKRQRAFMKHASCFGTMMAICLAIWALAGFGYFWPIWPLVIGGLKLGKHARETYGRPTEVDVQPFSGGLVGSSGLRRDAVAPRRR